MPSATASRPGATPDAAPGTAWSRGSLCAGAVLGLLTVASGALAAHLPAAVLSPAHRGMLQQATQMQGWHAAALLVCGLLGERSGSGASAVLLRSAAGCFAVGIVLFAGGVDALALGGGRAWTMAIGRLAPAGGTILMLGWLLLAAAALLRRSAAP